MARTREFDPAAALDAAMKVFWRYGYHATSIEDLVTGTGVSRYGLYGVYESKHGLFLAALDHYLTTVVRELAGVLHHDDASLDTIKDFIHRLGEIAAKPSGRIGCLLWNTATEVGPDDKAVARKVADFRTFLSTGFESALRNAVANGELRPEFDTKGEADFLAGVVQNLAALARSSASPRSIANFVNISLGTLS
ncbi:TetR/AcrR family transcriptional regulator [Methylocystis sp. Sn-Cys]|uniref:TetR/AcrR family transcriptional regulator n=1 Tax=Methylocystis sp. Sn-Cys TaxID=1701263 RepID=UPI0019222CB7|nr:TetR/AcrR family transcriptional regulator [Methylocystis sp. Sn-Cys]MBL1256033.1 TetR/AcrR family transcriptional regulator [Methylocystis sp. Sn-Cys]